MDDAIPSIVPNDIDKYMTHHYADNNGVDSSGYPAPGDDNNGKGNGYDYISLVIFLLELLLS